MANGQPYVVALGSTYGMGCLCYTALSSTTEEGWMSPTQVSQAGVDNRGYQYRDSEIKDEWRLRGQLLEGGSLMNPRTNFHFDHCK
ncbi:hypothetical protein Nepgr_025321 [Nepenthes gracilis]|uniref:Uncharacterized protein n=1 Tax=Nepenthes gracilis TaxID=150966 RepID=A0AAD3T4I8_NEPGR|nr:hypothetical protein Nepgr_025321 [Nepenthes gracilis]